MRIGIVSSEAVPFSKTGGLADVTGSLFKVFNELGNETFLFLPYYKITRSKMNGMSDALRVSVKIGDKNIIGSVSTKEISKGAHVVLIEQADYFDRDDLYGTKEGDYSDNAERFGFFDYAVIESIRALNIKLDVLHLNDWQTGLIPLFLKEKGILIKTLFTIHNLAYQGNFPKEMLKILHIDEKYFNMEGIEFYGSLSFIKSGIVYSDFISTVSPTYAKEILTEEYGERLDGILKMRKESLTGIVNGVDYKIWDSKTDNNIFKNYSLDTLRDKEENKNRLGGLLGIDFKGKPLFGMVSRIASQKGLGILVEALQQFLNEDVRVIVLGNGEKILENDLKMLEVKFPSKLKVIIGFDDALAHKIYASSDFFLMPSKYEPCGLGQLISLKYGAIPIVHETGGLKDTIDNLNDYTKCGNGLSFQEYSSKELLDAMNKAIGIYKDTETLNQIRKIAMLCDFSWENSAKKYLKLFERIAI
jgi:starch synthase